MGRFGATFLALVAGFFGLELLPPVQRSIVMPWTEAVARASAAVVTLFDAHVHAYGRLLVSTANGFAVSIEPGCNGVEAAIILAAAMIAFRAPLALKLAGIAGGIVAVQALNVVRVVSLFYLGQWNRPAFEWAHLYAWQALIMLDVLVVWLLWIQWVRRRERAFA